MSDHGSLSVSFRVAPATALPTSEEFAAGSGIFQETSGEIVADGDSASVVGVPVPATAAAAVEEDDDGHYGLR